MKKLTSILMIAAAVAATMACTPEEGGKDGGKGKTMEFSAKAPSFSGLSVAWKADSKIGVFADGSASTLSVVAEGSSVTAKGEVAKAAQYYAVTPYTGSETCEGGSITTSVPTEQVPVKDGISYEAAVAVASSSSTTFAFRSVVGIVKVELGSTGIKAVTLKSKGTENLSGSVKANAETAKSSVVEGKGTVAIVSDEALEPGVYYIAAIPATYVDGIDVTLTDSYGRVYTFSTEEFLSVRAGAVLDLGVVDDGAEFATPAYETTPANLAFKGDGETLEAVLPVEVKGTPEVSSPSWATVTVTGNKIKVTASANAPVPVAEEDPDIEPRTVDDVRYGEVKISGNSSDGPFTATAYIAQAGPGAKLVYDSFRESSLASEWKGNTMRAGVRLDGEGIHLTGSGDSDAPFALYWMAEQVRQKYTDGNDCNTFICSIDIKADTGCAGLIMFNKYGYTTDYNYALDHQFYRAWGSANAADNSGGFYCFNAVNANAMDGWEGDLSSGWFRLMVSNVSWSPDVKPDWGGKYIWTLKEDENGVLQRDQLVHGNEGGMWWWNDSLQLGTNYGFFGLFAKDMNEATVRNFTLSFTDKK